MNIDDQHFWSKVLIFSILGGAVIVTALDALVAYLRDRCNRGNNKGKG